MVLIFTHSFQRRQTCIRPALGEQGQPENTAGQLLPNHPGQNDPVGDRREPGAWLAAAREEGGLQLDAELHARTEERNQLQDSRVARVVAQPGLQLSGAARQREDRLEDQDDRDQVDQAGLVHQRGGSVRGRLPQGEQHPALQPVCGPHHQVEFHQQPSLNHHQCRLGPVHRSRKPPTNSGPASSKLP